MSEHPQHCVTLVTGGCRSGKSRYALQQASACKNPVFVATAEAHGPEMEARIARHRRERDPAFRTIEAPIDLAGALRTLPADAGIALVDCLTVWLSNLLCRSDASNETPPEIDELLDLLRNPPCDIILVTNEVGAGIVPVNDLARRFRDEAGFLNQAIAAIADTVVFVVCGIPTTIKPNQQG